MKLCKLFALECISIVYFNGVRPTRRTPVSAGAGKNGPGKNGPGKNGPEKTVR